MRFAKNSSTNFAMKPLPRFESDWQTSYREHRFRVENACSKVNSQLPAPPEPERQPLTYIELLAILADKGTVTQDRTFTKSPDTSIILRQNISNITFKPKKTRKRRRRVGRQTNNSDSDERRQNREYNIPSSVLLRYAYLGVEMDMLRSLLRPCIYFDMEIHKVRPLGRLVIQLFTEACPAVVFELVRSCMQKNQERLAINRLYPPMWLEGELAFEDINALNAPIIDHDMSVLDHGYGRGILSFPSRYVRGSERCFLSFSISFKPLNVFNGRRVAFGIVREGFWILDTIQKYGTRSGKPLKKIRIAKCGVI